MSNQLQVSGEAKIRSIQGPVVANSGVITALNGDATQYVRGDGTLADFPTSTGGGSSVSYYLNTSVSQGTIGGVAYKQLSKTPISGAGTDVSTSVDGYIASYITDANDPALLEVPAGNFNCEFYFSVNSNAHNPYVYAELYKYDGTTFTLLGSSQSVPEYLTNGTTLSPYYFAIPVATSVLTITDRIAIRIYVNVDGRTVTLHTENNHLCQVVTTFSKGLISLNNLIRQNQFFQTGTSGTDFNISSTTATHTFNLPVASATNTGKLSSTDWSTFNGKVPYTGATANVDLGNFNFDANEISGASIIAKLNGPASSPFILMSGSSGYTIGNDAISLISSPNVANTLIITSNISTVTKTAQIGLGSLSATRTYTLPDASGTLALLESTQVFSGSNTFTNNTIFSASPLFDQSANYKVGASLVGTGNYIGMAFDKSGTGSSSTLSMKLADGTSVKAINLDFVGSPATYTYTFPASSGTLALLQSTQTFSGSNTFSGFASFTSTSGTSLQYGAVIQKGFTPLVFGSNITNIYSDATTNNLVIRDNLSIAKLEFNNSTQTYTFPAATGTLTLGTGTTNYHAKWTGTNTIGNSLIWDNGTNVGIGNTNTSYTLDVTGTGYFSGALTGGSTAAFVGNVTAGDSGGGQVFRTANAGTSSVGIRLTNTGGNSFIGLSNSGGTGYLSGSAYALNIQTEGARDLQLGTNNTNRMTITSAGNVGIGTSSPNRILEVATGGDTYLRVTGNRGNADDLHIGNVEFYNSNTTRIIAEVRAITGTGGTQSNSGQLAFYTNNAGTYAERMRITSGGDVLVGQTVASGSSTGIYLRKGISSGFVSDAQVALELVRLNSNGQILTFWYGGTQVGSISTNTNSLPSDLNFKKNINNLELGLNLVTKLRAVSYNHKIDDNGAALSTGFIAQELEQSLTELGIEQNKYYILQNIPNQDKKQSQYWLDYTKMIPVLVKAIQEQQAQIEELKALIAAK